MPLRSVPRSISITHKRAVLVVCPLGYSTSTRLCQCSPSVPMVVRFAHCECEGLPRDVASEKVNQASQGVPCLAYWSPMGGSLLRPNSTIVTVDLYPASARTGVEQVNPIDSVGDPISRRTADPLARSDAISPFQSFSRRSRVALDTTVSGS